MANPARAASASGLSREEEAAFRAGLKAAAIRPFWEVNIQHSDEPVSEPAFLWRWKAIEPLVDPAVRAISVEDADRRALSFANPHIAELGRSGATTNLVAAVQVVEPGECAPAHRHTMGALRFAVQGSGIVTVVEGKRCPMLPGDIVFTPNWTWHEHVNEGADRALFIDVLDVPLHRYLKDAFYEAGPAHGLAPQLPDEAFAAAILVPDAAGDGAKKPYSPVFRYAWTTAVEALARVPQATDGSRKLRYVNPLTGEAAMELMDVFLIGLPKGRETRAARSTSNALCIVAEGEGTSQIGDERFSWEKNDVFTIPHWKWAIHRASADGTKLVMVTDRDLMRRLNLLRDEFAD
jgi:gentisate 1,2-dioxygenase